MEIFAQKDVLKTFRVLVDTREQQTKRAEGRYRVFGSFDRVKLDYGDYAYNCQLPDGKWIYPADAPIYPVVSVERKMNLDELAECFTWGRKRFTAEFERAKEHGARVYLLVENATWENLLNGKYRSKFNPAAFEASILAWQARYQANVIFCKEETSGKLIKDILYRELKERLERGDYG